MTDAERPEPARKAPFVSTELDQKIAAAWSGGRLKDYVHLCDLAQRVSDRRAADAAKAGRALDRMLSECDGLGCRCCNNLERLARLTQSELHHNGHYDVSLPTGGDICDIGQRDPGLGCPGMLVCDRSSYACGARQVEP